MVPPGPRRLLVAGIALLAFGAIALGGPANSALGAGTPHLVLIVMENKNYESVVGSTTAPYINGTLIPASLVFTQYYATEHPSLPNYLALTSAGSAGCVTDSCPAGFDPDQNLFHQMDAQPVTWRAYAESMPSNCYPTNTTLYLVRHNPPAYYSNLAGGSCATNDVPYSQFATDLQAGTLPAFSFIAPNKFNGMHNDQKRAPCLLGSAIPDEVCQGDTWLSQNVPPLLALNSDADPTNDVTVVLTFDEGATGAGGGGHVLTLVTGPNVAPGQDAAMYGHLGLLNAIEDWFGLARLHPDVPSI